MQTQKLDMPPRNIISLPGKLTRPQQCRPLDLVVPPSGRSCDFNVCVSVYVFKYRSVCLQASWWPANSVEVIWGLKTSHPSCFLWLPLMWTNAGVDNYPADSRMDMPATARCANIEPKRKGGFMCVCVLGLAVLSLFYSSGNWVTFQSELLQVLD